MVYVGMLSWDTAIDFVTCSSFLILIRLWLCGVLWSLNHSRIGCEPSLCSQLWQYLLLTSTTIIFRLTLIYMSVGLSSRRYLVSSLNHRRAHRKHLHLLLYLAPHLCVSKQLPLVNFLRIVSANFLDNWLDFILLSLTALSCYHAITIQLS